MGWFVTKVGWFVTNVNRNLQTKSKDFDFETSQTITGAARSKVILQRFPTARKTSINPECRRVVPPALEKKFIKQNLPENHALYTEHNPGGTMELVENPHGLISTRACRRHNGPRRKQARTDEYSSLQKRQWTSKIRTDTHRLMTTRACSKNSGPARTKESRYPLS